MDSYPKLLPTWHDIALQDLLRRKAYCYGLLRDQHPPNYGGIGIDVNNNSDCKDSNYAKKQMALSANSCALPFFNLKKIQNIEDPCLEALKREKFEFDKFCLKLTYVRNSAKSNRWSDIKALKHRLSVSRRNNGNEEVNIEAPKSLVHLAENLPKRVFFPKFNVAYAGGALGVSKSSNTLNLLHPVAGALNKLCITPLQSDSVHNFQPGSHGKRTFNLGKEPILQIEPAINDFCYVRQKSSFHLVNVTSKDIFSERVREPHGFLYHTAISPYYPMEILHVYEKGMMKLWNIETRKCSSISEDLHDFSLQYPTWRCAFGSHLFSALCMNEKKVYSIDFREKSRTKKEVFSIDNPSCYVGEELVAMKQCTQNPFQHLLSSSHHLIFCDERYPKIPVLYWNHTLRDPPIYLECADLDSNVSCIVIGTQETQELASFLFSHETNIQPVSLTPPLLLSSPTDCLESLKLHCYHVDDEFFSRLSSPLTGVCIAPDDKEIGFTVLQSTSLGDIFYQDFKQSESAEKTYRVSTGCVLTPPERILPLLEESISSSTDTNKAPEDLDEAITHLKINIDRFLTPPKEISSNCTLCRLRNSSVEKELVISEICPSCSLNSAESQHFSKAEANLSAVIGPTSEESSSLDFDIDYFLGFTDPYSKKILSVWLESDDFEDGQTTFSESMMIDDS